MINIYKTVDCRLVTLDAFEEGVWVNLANPTAQEIKKVSEDLRADPDSLKAALDEEERARIEYDAETEQTLIIIDIPIVDQNHVYSTIPLGIILLKHSIITVCLKEETFLNDFLSNAIKNFHTQYRTRFVLQILYKNATRYLNYLKHIDRMSNKIEADLHKAMRNKELFQMLKLEKSLVFFSTSLKSNEAVLERLTRHDYIKRYPEDAELLDDVITENKQAIEMSGIYSSIMASTTDAFASVISNNLNIVMKFLTSVTIVMAIPTMISSFFGMNVDMPIDLTNGFWYIVGASVIGCIAVGLVLYKKKMF